MAWQKKSKLYIYPLKWSSQKLKVQRPLSLLPLNALRNYTGGWPRCYQRKPDSIPVKLRELARDAAPRRQHLLQHLSELRPSNMQVGALWLVSNCRNPQTLWFSFGYIKFKKKKKKKKKKNKFRKKKTSSHGSNMDVGQPMGALRRARKQHTPQMQIQARSGLQS